MAQEKDISPAAAPVEQDMEAGTVVVENSSGVQEAAKSQSEYIPLDNLTAPTPNESAATEESQDARKYISGWKLYMLTIG
jgi:hypothetical protein